MLFLVLVADFFVLVLVFVNGIVIFSFLVIFVFVNENHTAVTAARWMDAWMDGRMDESSEFVV